MSNDEELDKVVDLSQDTIESGFKRYLQEEIRKGNPQFITQYDSAGKLDHENLKQPNTSPQS